MDLQRIEQLKHRLQRVKLAQHTKWRKLDRKAGSNYWLKASLLITKLSVKIQEAEIVNSNCN